MDGIVTRPPVYIANTISSELSVQWPLCNPGLLGATGGRSPGLDGREGTGRAGGAGLETLK